MTSRLYKELKEQRVKTNQTNKQTHQRIHLKNWLRTWRDNSLQKKQMAKKCLKKCSSFLAAREMQIKTTLKVHHTSVRMMQNKGAANSKHWREAERQGKSCSLLEGRQTVAAIMEISVETSQNQTKMWNKQNPQGTTMTRNP